MFSRGYTDSQKAELRLAALDVDYSDIKKVAEKYIISAIETGSTSRVVFGS